MTAFESVYGGKTVLVTGHTGFKGSWLSEWLCLLGAKVVGYSLAPAQDLCFTSPSHFAQLGLRDRIAAHIEDDVTDWEAVHAAFIEHRPDFVFHLAAQPLVRRAYDEPLLTVETNVRGTLNLLEAARRENRPCIMIMITTDKVYENAGWLHSYREPDRLGGGDTYSASKACAELLISSYWRSFFAPHLAEKGITLASVRGGNVIGGGDWAKDRIVPDAMRALSGEPGDPTGEKGKQPVEIRNRYSTRPWQNVLELLSGYLHLGALTFRRRETFRNAGPQQKAVALSKLQALCSPFNFGPFLESNRSVETLVDEILKHWPGDKAYKTEANAPEEAGKLNLTIDKAYHMLGWHPKWTFEETIERTVHWYHEFYTRAHGNAEAVRELTQAQIRDYSAGLSYSMNE
jgi:CDP-glucose 4,6-dehydratase